MTRNRIIPFDEVPYVGHVQVRLAPIDVGFDLRGEGICVELPPDCDCATYAIDGERFYVEGEHEFVAETLRAAGYILAEDHR